MTSTKLESVLSSFFIFTPTMPVKEGDEHKKLLWYTPSSDTVDVKVRRIGFCEAAVKFSSSFSEEPSCLYSVVTDKQLQVYYQPEEEYIMGMIVKDSQMETSGAVADHLCDQGEKVFQALLKFAYNMYRLFCGSFTDTVKEHGLEVLRSRLDYFYSRYVPTITISKSPLLDIYGGIDFMPLNKLNYLKLQSVVNKVLTIFPLVKHAVILYNSKLLWYSIPQDDMCVLYRYLANNLMPNFLRQELQPNAHKDRGSSSAHYYGKFVTGPPDLRNDADMGKIPKIYLENVAAEKGKNEGGASSSGDSDQKSGPADFLVYQLVIYRALNMTVCLLVDGDVTLEFEFFKNVDTVLGTQFSALASDVGDIYSKIRDESNHHYVYYNGETKSVRSTLNSDSSLVGGDAANRLLPSDISPLLCDLQESLHRTDFFADFIVKTDSDTWVSGVKSGKRELFVILNQKNANLTDVTEEIRKLTSSHFQNLFMLH